MKYSLPLFALLLAPLAAQGAPTGISQSPLLNIAGSGVVKPNLMVLYDNSGSMGRNFTPDYVDDALCRAGATLASATPRGCKAGDPPFSAAEFNKQYYNPNTRYEPPVKADHTRFASMTAAQTANWTNVPTDPHLINQTDLRNNADVSTNLVTEFPDYRWCNSSGVCVTNSATYAYPDANYRTPGNIVGAPYYYRINAAEHCSDTALKNCISTAVGAPAPASHPYPAKVRFCTDRTLTTCQAKYMETHPYPRFSVFSRVDIIASRDSYPRGPNRADCASPTRCTYVEEMTNFANWYAYYRTRNQMMKAAVGMAFDPISDKYNVGLVSLSVAAAAGAMPNTPKPFTGPARQTWFDALYAMNGTGTTPTRPALHNIGRMYANLGTYAKPAGSEVVQYPCQQNFTFVTTDGYWNGNAAADVANIDTAEDPARFCTFASGCVEPSAGVSLSDVALYWYNGGTNGAPTSLRPTLEGPEGLVRGKPGTNKRLHMATFTLGLGVDGLMTYEPNYKNRPIAGGDFQNVINRVATGCPWNNNNAWIWPDPKVNLVSSVDPQSRVDDLWHAAVNGRGQYFSAAEPDEVVQSLTTALLEIEAQNGAAAAAATSTPNISLQDNDIFSDTFTTVKWYGEIVNRKIDTVTGEVITAKRWSSSDTVGAKVFAARDDRVIKMLDVANGGLKDFTFTAMTAGERAWFADKCTALFQCGDMTTEQRAIANNGIALVDWLRGQQQHADDAIFRSYSSSATIPGSTTTLPLVLGDIASSKPAFMREPRLGYDFDGYPAFIDANLGRQPTVFVGANDGMLHAFNATNGTEMWAYAPRIVMKKLHKQASTSYGSNHQYTVDGSPEISDVQINGVWKSILVSGLNGGGRGYFALDVTNPAAPVALWEICADRSVCTGSSTGAVSGGISRYDGDIGLTFGNPQFGKWNGRWVVFVASGYNNIPGVEGGLEGSGNGFLYVLDAATGAVLSKTATMAGGMAAGSVTTPSGLARITAVNDNPSADPVITQIYGGDNLGNMWRFQMGTTVTVSRMGTSGSTQPITTRPEVTSCRTTNTVAGETVTGVTRVVLYGTGRMLDVPDLSNTDVQALYALKDSPNQVNVTGTTMVQQTLSDLGSGRYKITQNTMNFGTKDGWFVRLDRNARERVNLDPAVVAGSVTVVTNIPSASTTCSVGGSSKVYQLNVCTGSNLNTSSTVWVNGDAVVGDTLSANAAAVGFILVRLPTGVIKMITTTADGGTITDDAGSTKSHGPRKAGWRRVNK